MLYIEQQFCNGHRKQENRESTDASNRADVSSTIRRYIRPCEGQQHKDRGGGVGNDASDFYGEQHIGSLVHEAVMKKQTKPLKEETKMAKVVFLKMVVATEQEPKIIQ